MVDQNKRVTVRVEDLALSNTVTLNALVELLEEKGLVTKNDVLARVKRIRDKETSSRTH